MLARAFFRTQVLEHAQYSLQSETNRLREVPLPAPRGIIYDRNGEVIAENLPAYSVSISAPRRRTRCAQRCSGLRATLAARRRSRSTQAVRRFRRAPNGRRSILPDASFDVVSVLEEHASISRG